jgi:hypothetical protein
VRGLALLGALALGVAFGYGAQRGAFCLNSGFRNAVRGDGTKVKALLLAIAIQLVALPLVVGAGWAHPMSLPVMPIAAIAGGLLFGLSMPWAGGCAAGVWYKLGAGDLGALLAVVGLALGATATDSGPLAGLRTTLQLSVPSAVVPAPPALVSVGAGVLLAAVLTRLADGRSGAWRWRRTGLWVGATATVAWVVSAIAGRNFGLAVVPGTAGVLAGATGRPLSGWDTLLVLGIPAGGFLAARRTGPVRLGAPAPPALLRRFAGGLGLGIGASIAGGCTVGQGVTGLGIMAPSGVLVMGSIFGGSALATILDRRRSDTGPRPAVDRAPGRSVNA